MAAASGSSAKLYRFPPTRELLTDNDAVVPPAQGRGRHARELEDYLRRRQEGAVDEPDAQREYPVIVPPVETSTDVGCGESSQESWPSRMEGSLLRKIAGLRRALYLAGKEGKEAEDGMTILMQGSRESPSAAACVLSRHMPRVPRLEEVVPGHQVRCAAGSSCGKRALPFSRFCLLHISSDVDQVLYGTCTAPEPGTGTCGTAVPDFLLNQPLCSKHITKTALETNVQQQKRKNAAASASSRVNKTKGKSQKNKKTKTITATTVTKLVVTKSSPAVATSSAAVGLSSTSSWSSGESDGENPLINETKRPKIVKPSQPPPPVQTKAKDPHQLPSLTPEATLDLSLSAPMPSLILPPPLPDIGKFMDDSSSEES